MYRIYTKNIGMASGYIYKILLIMRLTTVLLIATMMQVSAASFAQKISLKEKNAPIEKIFNEIRLQSGYDFLFNRNLLKSAKRVDIHVQDASLEEALKACFAEQPFTYTLEEKTIIVKAKDPTFLERVVATLASGDVHGCVVDAEGKPLPGATVKVKATGKGVSTDGKGNFYLKNVEEGTVLVVSYTGYVSREVKAAKEMGNIALEVSLSKLDEVQVIAYGTTTQRLSTGNVTTIKADVIEKQPVNNPLLALQGRVPGLFIEQSSGFAGTGIKVRIQGTNSISNGNEPLYVIDGVPYFSRLLPSITGSNILNQPDGRGTGNPLNFINPSDIESIDVLKDADATSIYGSRAANGAILITTKRGKAGDIKVNLNLQSGIGQVAKKLDLMNSQQYIEMRKEALRMDGMSVPSLTAYDINGTWDVNRNTDWQKELLGGSARYHNAQVSISGGGDYTQFLISGTYHKENTVFPGDFTDKKGATHLSLTNSSANRKFKLQFSANYLLDNNFLPGGYDLTDYALKLAPNAPALFTKEGLINWAPNSDGVSTFENPISYLFNTYNNLTNNLVSNLQLSYSLMPGLDLKGSFSYNRLNSDEKYIIPSTSTKPEDLASGVNPRQGYYGSNNTKGWVIEPQLTYARKIGPGRLDALIASTFQQNKNESLQLYGYGYISDQMIADIKSATNVVVTSTLNSDYKYNALFGRINYNVNDKYILSINLRRDGSSRFGPKNQFHNFGSGALAWIFSNEKIIKTKIPFLSFGKLSSSYGTTGSDQTSDYQFLNLYSPVGTDNSYQQTVGLEVIGLTNPYLQWEETKKIQTTLDLGFLNDRILFKSTYFNNRSSNQLLRYKLPIFAGFNGIMKNFPAIVQNSGLEISISSINLLTNNFKWSSNVNITIPNNKLIDFPNLSTSNYASTLVIGQPITLIKQFHFLGVDPATGVYVFADSKGNPTTNPVNVFGALNNDKYIIANPDPKFYGGFQNTLSYKGFELDVFFQFVKQMGRDFSLGNAPGSPRTNQPSSVLNYWQKPGDVAPIQRVNNDFSLLNSFGMAAGSDATWSDASYIRLKNLSISWSLPKSWIKNIHVDNFRLFVQGQNLLTITNYYGLDPETKSSGTLPPLRVITAGVKVNL
jgi:TonB-linked SusC/RagA family outer membrane protein